MKNICETVLAGSQQKIFPDWQPVSNPVPLTVLQDDLISFQVAVRWNETMGIWANIRLETDIPAEVVIRPVKLSPSAYPVPGLFPDRLAAPEKGHSSFAGRFKLVPGQFRSLWVDVETALQTPGGIYDIRLIGEQENGDVIFDVKTEVEVIPAPLPEGEVYHTEWLYADCLADYYQVPVFGEKHFEILEHFIRTAVHRGVNTLLTPLFTYPLDTAEGGERTTVQLVGVTLDQGAYAFDFTLLDRWVDMCEGLGVGYYELSHLYSQWGAKYAPRIMVSVDGAMEPRFGWHTSGSSAEYQGFLAAFLPELDRRLRQLGIEKRCFVHVSDEPEEKDFHPYREARRIVETLLPGYPVMDALSDFMFYRSGAADRPIPSIDRIQPFLDAGVPDLWTYYCVAQSKDVSNRFFTMPLSRTRILGTQMYQYQLKGFLHWGYNFYNSQYSLRHIDPYVVTDADESFPSGDPFLVYPGADGRPEESLRLMMMDAAFRDIRALRLMESLTGRASVLELINRVLDYPTLMMFPVDDESLLRLRYEVNRAIAKKL